MLQLLLSIFEETVYYYYNARNCIGNCIWQFGAHFASGGSSCEKYVHDDLLHLRANFMQIELIFDIKNFDRGLVLKQRQQK